MTHPDRLAHGGGRGLRRRCGRRWPCGVAALYTALLATACATNPVSGTPDFVLVTEREEVEEGARSLPRVLAAVGGEHPDRRLGAYVQGVGLRVAAVSDRPEIPYQFVVVSSAVVNAVALGGGPVMITTGMLTAIDDEAELAAVLAHEVGHIAARHQVRQQAWGTVAGLLVHTLNVTIRTPRTRPLSLSRLSAGLALMTYSRSAEMEADALAIDYLARAGYDPLAGVRVQEAILRAGDGAEDDGVLGALLRSHPIGTERIAAAREAAAALRTRGSWPRDPEVGRERFRAETQRLRG